jgi:secreted trypsin-like serine protease
MSRALTLTVAVALLLAPGAARAAGTPRITGGALAAPVEAPYMAALFDRTKAPRYFECGATVVAPRAILTAAHCVEELRAEWLVVRVGSNDLRNGGRLVQVARVRIHPRYDRDARANDIAVLRLAQDAGVPAVGLPGSDEPALVAGGRAAIAYGWGAQTQGGKVSRLLKSGSVRVVPASGCVPAWRMFVAIDSRLMLCAAGGDGFVPDTCSGDSGGPLVATNAAGAPVEVGVTAFGGPVCGKAPPSIYTRVAPYARWVSRQAGLG